MARNSDRALGYGIRYQKHPGSSCANDSGSFAEQPNVQEFRFFRIKSIVNKIWMTNIHPCLHVFAHPNNYIIFGDQIPYRTLIASDIRISITMIFGWMIAKMLTIRRY